MTAEKAMAGGDLLPCPFCGSGPARGPGRYTSASFSGVEIMDPTNEPYVWCGTCCSRTRVCDSQSEAIKIWNTRPAMLAYRDQVRREVVGEASVEKAAQAIYDAIDPLSGDHIATVIHMSDHLFWDGVGAGSELTDIERQLEAVRIICRAAAVAALSAAAPGEAA